VPLENFQVIRGDPESTLIRWARQLSYMQDNLGQDCIKGLTVYDENNVLRVLIGLLSNKTYGIKVTQGEIYSTTFRTGTETATTYIAMVPPNLLQVWSSVAGVAKLQLEIAAPLTGGGGGVDFYVDDTFCGQIKVDSLVLGIQGINRSISLSGTNVVSSADIIPSATTTGSVGTNACKWALVRAVTITPGDLGFEERTCAVCGEQFKSGESLVLLVKEIHEDYGTLTIPIHERCKGKTAKFEMEMPEVEEKFMFKEDGNVESYKTVKFEEATENIYRLKEGYSFCETTGNFKKDKEQLATKEEAVEVVQVVRRRMVMKKITVETGKAGA